MSGSSVSGTSGVQLRVQVTDTDGAPPDAPATTYAGVMAVPARTTAPKGRARRVVPHE
jgi:hypothetical protein